MNVDAAVHERIVRCLQNRLRDGEDGELARWRAQSPENERYYQEMQQLWWCAREASPESVAPRPSAAFLLARSGAPREVAAWGRAGVWRSAWLRAAAVVLLVGLGYAGARYPRSASPLGVTEFTTGNSEMVTVRLADSTTVRLGPRSRLTIDATPGGRTVRLDGHAFFAVAKRAGKPFVVRTRVGQVTVLGTRFDVNVNNDDLRLLVVQGRVALKASGEQVQVGANEMTHVVAGSRPSTVAVSDVQSMLAWMGGTLVFQDTPARQAVEEIENRYRVQVELDPGLADRTVTAEFTGQSFEEVLTVLCRVIVARCVIEGTVAQVRR